MNTNRYLSIELHKALKKCVNLVLEKYKIVMVIIFAWTFNNILLYMYTI